MEVQMKKIIFLVVALMGLISLLAIGSSCVGRIVGSGRIITKDYNFTNFTEVDISSFFKYEINRSDSFGIKASTYENIIDHLDITQSGKTLLVRFKPGVFNTDTNITITMPELSKLVVSGASRGSAKGFQSSNQYDLEVSGASQLEMDVEAGNTKVNVSGASKVTGNLRAGETRIVVSGASGCDISGSAGLTTVEVSGASHFDSLNFHMQNANINVSGASHAAIYTSGTLNLDVTGASTLDYSGNPILSKVNVSGASKLNSK
jgi:hypothetical protein